MARHALASAEIPAITFRGAALIEADLYPDPASRPMSDVDLLVPLSLRERAFRALRDGGFVPWVDRPDPTPGWLDAVTLTAPGEVEGIDLTIDLHWRVSRGGLRLGGPGLEEALPDSEWTAPRDGPHFLHLAEHYLRHLRVLVHAPAVEDLVRLAPRVTDWDEVIRLGREGPLAPGVAALLEAVRLDRGVAIPEEVPRELGRPRPDTVAGMREGGRFGTPPASRLEGLRRRLAWAGGVRRGVPESLSALLPDAAWLAARFPATPRPLRLPRLWSHAAAWLLGLATSPTSGNQEFETPPAGPGAA